MNLGIFLSHFFNIPFSDIPLYEAMVENREDFSGVNRVYQGVKLEDE